MTSGRVYRRFKVKHQTVILRAMRWDDTDRLLTFINGLVDEKRKGKSREVFTGFEEKVSRGEEAAWLTERIVEIENGNMISVLAEVNGDIVANGEIARGPYRESRHHGRLALTVMAAYRGMGIGREMVKVLLREAKTIGVKNLEVEFLSTNQAAIRTYQSAGFREVGRIPGKVYRGRKFLDSLIMAREVK